MRSILINSFLLALISSGFSQTLPKHYHETNGWGTKTEAGLGGKVVKVTNLKNSGAGSLRDALGQSGARLIVFEVGGVIDLGGKTLSINNGQCTIAGQTAPSPGITLIRGDVRLNGKDIVMSHITTRLGTKVGKAYDAMDISGENIVLDHVAASWSADECVSMGGAKYVTMYKTMVTEAISVGIHREGEHSKGSLIQGGTDNTSLIQTFYAHNALRNPRLHSRSQVALINGVIYNWFPGADDEGAKRFHYIISMADAQMSIAGVLALQGPQSVGEILVSGHKHGKGSAYMKDNIILDPSGKALIEYNTENITPLDEPPLWPDGVEVIPAKESFYEVLRTVGPRPGDREAITARVIKTVAEGTGEIVHSEEQVGGYPKYAETKQPVTVPDGVAARRAWLDSLEDAIAVDTALDLSRLYGIVGAQEDDKFAPQTNALHKKIDTGIKLTQKLSVKNQLQLWLSLPTANTVSLTIYDIAGNAVVQEPQKHFQAGSHEMAVNSKQLQAGLYICRYRIGGTVANHKLFCY